MAMQKKPWFAPKRIGYGSGLPISCEGWLVLGLYLAGVLLAVRFLPTVAMFIAVAFASGVLAVICAMRTEGGWRWRNGR